MVDVQVSKITVTIGKRVIRFSMEDALELYDKLESVLYPEYSALKKECKEEPAKDLALLKSTNGTKWFNGIERGIQDLNNSTKENADEKHEKTNVEEEHERTDI